MNDLDALRAAVASGDMEACGPLSDALEDFGHAAIAVWVRSRLVARKQRQSGYCRCALCTSVDICEYVARTLAE